MKNNQFFNLSKALFSNISKDLFYREYFDKKTMINRNGFLTYDFSVTAENINEFLFSNKFNPSDIEIFKDSRFKKNKSYFFLESYQLNRNKVSSYINEENYSIRVSNSDKYSKHLLLLKSLFEKTFSAKVTINLYYTPANSRGLIPHRDDYHIVVIQASGKKEWFINKENFQLYESDYLYIPTGLEHCAETREIPSIHYTIGIHTN